MICTRIGSFRLLAAFALAASLAAGCGSSQPRARPVTASSDPSALMKLQAEPSGEFERQKDPKFSVDTRFAAGQLAESQNAPARAVEQYKEGLRINPNHVETLYRLGIVYTQIRKFPDAVETWKQYCKATRGSAIGYSNLGFAYELAGQLDLAEKAYKEGISKESANAPCRVNYGLMLARNGRTNEAIQQLQSVLTPSQVHYNLASVYESIGRREQAKIEYRRSIELDPDFGDAQARLDALE